MSDETDVPDLTAMARDVLDGIRYIVLGTIDEDGRTRTSPVYFVPHGYQDLYWVSNPASHHSRNLERDDRLSGVVFDSTVPPGPDQRAVYVTGTAREVQVDEIAQHLPKAFDSGRGGRAFTAEELTGDADLRLWLLHVDSWEVHIRGGHPTLGTGTDRRMPVDPRG
jgi:nitroimidazol reductase NimA-like FMN-containing flavoprotein (pyridoxamine 5'-phosphate oxidase superfamily)